MRHEQFEAREPVELYVEIQGGSVHLDATGSTDVSVEIEGTHADEVLVEQRGRSLRGVAPRPAGPGRRTRMGRRPAHPHSGRQ